MIDQKGVIIKTKISALTFEETVNQIQTWSSNKKRSYVCICNTHSLVTAYKNEQFRDALENSALNTPDGMPLVWGLKMLGFKRQNRVDGPNLMLKLCEDSGAKNTRIFLYGNTDENLKELEKELKAKYPDIKIVGKYSPPFRKLSQEEQESIIRMINDSHADITFVSLGCPKQELWMYKNSQHINGIMIGVGAAFDFIIGKVKRPPMIFQKMGLEWLFRLLAEPKRLWKRYFYNNPMYVYLFIKTYRKNKKIQNII
ncbi:glycosyltransferase [Priestia megaterium]|uniref:WecB/TagA/CpsF family glycosyltransferase n=1 Tax=Priestia megaterium TaxID=1404 RepID=UPI000BF54FED|nr:WecB/TagA/CpsF family glycosyltransferase [Priestia megaterium]PFL70513.1 glycosyltransferase [Priestia megaterium]